MKNQQQILKINGFNIFYNYIFDIGAPVNPIDAARLLLKTDFSQAFRNYINSHSEVAERFKDLFEKYNMVKDIDAELKNYSGIPSLIRAFRRAPVLVGKAILEGFFKESEKKRRRSYSKKTSISVMEEIVGGTIKDLLVLLAVHEYADRQIFSADYLDGNPFTRVGLEPFRATVFSETITFDVTVTIHRTGIAILTAYGVFEREITPDKFAVIQRVSNTDVTNPEMPTSIFQAFMRLLKNQMPEYSSIMASTEQVEDGAYTRFKGRMNGLASIFDAYRFSIIETIRQTKFPSSVELYKSLRSGQWHAYPVIFIKRTTPVYKTGRDFKQTRSKELVGITMGLGETSFLKDDFINSICGQDLSIFDDHSVYFTEGSATIIYYDSYHSKVPRKIAGAEWARRHFLTTVIIDILLIQRMILLIFNTYLDSPYYNIDKLNELKRTYLGALDEFEAIGISHYGQVHDIIKKSQEHFRIIELRRLFLAKAEGIEKAVDAIELRKKVERERNIKVLTTLVTTVVSLAAAQSFVDTIRKWNPSLSGNYPVWTSTVYETIIRLITTHPTRATVILYATIVTIAIISVWYGNLQPRRKGKNILHPNLPSTSTARTVSPVQYNLSEYQPGNNRRTGQIGRRRTRRIDK